MSTNSPEFSRVSNLKCPDHAPHTKETEFYPDFPDNLAIASQWICQLMGTENNIGKYSLTFVNVSSKIINTKLTGTLTILENGQLRIGESQTSPIVKMGLEKIQLNTGMKTVYFIETSSGSKYMLQDWKLN